MSVSRSRAITGLSGIVGGYAPLDSGLLVPRAYLPQIAGLLHNMAASTAPAVTDDSGDGYGVGSRWLDTTDDTEYVCLDTSVGAAVWFQTTAGGAWTAYTPTLTAATTNPTIGNGSLVGRYKLLGSKLCAVSIYWQFGSTSNAGSGNYTFALPFASVAGRAQVLASAIVDSGTRYFTSTTIIVAGGTGTSVCTVADGASSTLTHNNPMTWATNDSVSITGIYEIA